MLQTSARAHGSQALATLNDISVRYAGQWNPVVNRLQPDLVDAGFRGGSEERLLLRDRIVAQSHTGPSGTKFVVRTTAASGEGAVRVWFNGAETQGPSPRAAAALVADGYTLFLLGPMLLAGRWATDRSLVMALAGTERIIIDGQPHECDIVRIRMAPGQGFSPAEQLALYIDRTERLMRRIRFTLDGLDSTRNALAEVDCSDHRTIAGIRWPTRFHEHLLRPLPISVHDWRLTGLDVDRRLNPAMLAGPTFLGAAVPPAVAI